MKGNQKVKTEVGLVKGLAGSNRKAVALCCIAAATGAFFATALGWYLISRSDMFKCISVFGDISEEFEDVINEQCPDEVPSPEERAQMMQAETINSEEEV